MKWPGFGGWFKNLNLAAQQFFPKGPTSSQHPPGEPEQFSLRNSKHLPVGNVFNALIVSTAPAPAVGARAVLRATQLSAWCKRADGGCVQLERGKSCFIGVLDELVFDVATATTPPSQPLIAFTLVEEENGQEQQQPNQVPQAAQQPGAISGTVPVNQYLNGALSLAAIIKGEPGMAVAALGPCASSQPPSWTAASLPPTGHAGATPPGQAVAATPTTAKPMDWLALASSAQLPTGCHPRQETHVAAAVADDRLALAGTLALGLHHQGTLLTAPPMLPPAEGHVAVPTAAHDHAAAAPISVASHQAGAAAVPTETQPAGAAGAGAAAPELVVEVPSVQKYRTPGPGSNRPPGQAVAAAAEAAVPAALHPLAGAAAVPEEPLGFLDVDMDADLHPADTGLGDEPPAETRDQSGPSAWDSPATAVKPPVAGKTPDMMQTPAGAGMQQAHLAKDQAPPSALGTGALKTPGRADVMADCKTLIEQVEALILQPVQGGATNNGGNGNGTVAPDSAAAAPPPLVGPELCKHWRQELRDLMQRCTSHRTTIGVVGNTGAGKSSLLNVLLGEEDILPTNGMRASTGCPIEVAYAPSTAYRAEVEFLTREEWQKCLERLMEDMRDEHGKLNISAAETCNTRSEAGAAQAMLEAVYGREVIRGAALSLERLRSHSNAVTRLLGTTKEIRHHDRKDFRREIGKYVDSHNKAGDAQAWPIVKVCRIQHKWKLLESGAVLVDLPGVRDANEARGAVAEEYMKRLDAVWVVADITRAVDDKTAKDLLGNTFRRQLVLDGQLRALTFVCTKTDNIQVSGAEDELGGPEEVCARSGVALDKYLALKDKLENLRQQEEDALKATKEANRSVATALAKCTKACKEANTIQKCILDQQPKPLPEGLRKLMQEMVPPGPAAKKKGRGRKAARRNSGEAGPRRAAGYEDSEDEDEEEDDEVDSDGVSISEEEEDASSEADDDSDYCTEEEGTCSGDGSEESEVDVSEDDSAAGDGGSDDGGSGDDGGSDRRSRGAKRKRPTKKRARTSKSKINNRLISKYRSTPVAELMELLRELVQTYTTTTRPDYAAAVRQSKKAKEESAAASQRLPGPQREMTSYCAIARNNFSRERLQQDFREGLKEVFDTPNMAAGVRNDDQQQPQHEEERPDHQVPDLPVFCISAREAQKMEGRNKKDGRAQVFTKLSETEVPGLRKHVKEIAERSREQAQQQLAQALFEFIDSVGKALLNKRLDTSPEVAAALRQLIYKSLDGLKARLLSAWDAQYNQMCSDFLDSRLSPSLNSGFKIASDGAEEKIRQQGAGLHWATYRAITRRGGCYTRPRDKLVFDFNGLIVGPLSDAISAPWDWIFNTRFPQVLSAAKSECLAELERFSEWLRSTVPERFGVSVDRLDALSAQVRRDEQRQLTDRLAKLEGEVLETARELNRSVLEPTIRKGMAPTYDLSASRRGTGSTALQVQDVNEQVRRHGTELLRTAAVALLDEVERLLAVVHDRIRSACKELVAGAKVRFALLWDKPLSSFEERVRAATALRQLALAAGELCRRVHLDVGEPFALPAPTPARRPRGGQAHGHVDGGGDAHQDDEADEGEEEDEDEGGEGEEYEGEEGDDCYSGDEYSDEGEEDEEEEEEDGMEGKEGCESRRGQDAEAPPLTLRTQAEREPAAGALDGGGPAWEGHQVREGHQAAGPDGPQPMVLTAGVEAAVVVVAAAEAEAAVAAAEAEAAVAAAEAEAAVAAATLALTAEAEPGQLGGDDVAVDVTVTLCAPGGVRPKGDPVVPAAGLVPAAAGPHSATGLLLDSAR